MCNLAVDKQVIANKYHIIFDEYFTEALDNLVRLEEDGLVEITQHSIKVPEKARIYIRAICARFDAYLNVDEPMSNCASNRYSKAI